MPRRRKDQLVQENPQLGAEQGCRRDGVAPSFLEGGTSALWQPWETALNVRFQCCPWLAEPAWESGLPFLSLRFFTWYLGCKHLHPRLLGRTISNVCNTSTIAPETKEALRTGQLLWPTNKVEEMHLGLMTEWKPRGPWGWRLEGGGLRPTSLAHISAALTWVGVYCSE